MCGGVRGVGAGGIVSSAYCLLLKLGTLKLTRKQVTGMINHADSPYIRGLGFMYLRYIDLSLSSSSCLFAPPRKIVRNNISLSAWLN